MELEDLSKRPDALGFSSEGLKTAHNLLEAAATKGMYTAASYLILRHGKIAAQGAIGCPSPEHDNTKKTDLQTIFDLASITKTFTSTLLLQSVARGQLHLGMKVKDFLSDTSELPIGNLTLKQLATHTSGLPAWKALYKEESDTPFPMDMLRAIKPDVEPSTKYTYSDLGYILLGEILVRLHNLPLDALTNEQILTPLKMERSGFRPVAKLRDNMAATANCSLRKGRCLLGEVHDANSHSLGGVSGHAGMFASAHDLARYAVSLFCQKEAERRMVPTILPILTTRLATRNQIPEIGGHSIGWFTYPNGMLPRGDQFSTETFGHTGFTGTLLMHDPTCGVTTLLLTNRVYNPNDGSPFLRLRWLYANAIAGAIVRDLPL